MVQADLQLHALPVVGELRLWSGEVHQRAGDPTNAVMGFYLDTNTI